LEEGGGISEQEAQQKGSAFAEPFFISMINGIEGGLFSGQSPFYQGQEGQEGLCPSIFDPY
jgi:hypothetical protein